MAAILGMFVVSLGGESIVCSGDEAMAVAGRLHATYGGVPKVEPLKDDAPTLPATIAVVAEPVPVAAAIVATAPVYSDFGHGNQIVDASAKARIEAQHAALIASGVNVDASQQLYATGTRMAKSGYETQAARAVEHAAKLPARDAASALRAAVVAEDRHDETVSAREFANALHVNGKVTAFGLALSEQAIRGLTSRLESPALGYLLGLRNRIAAEVAKGDEGDRDAIQRDKATMAEVLRHECKRAGDVALTMRTRKANRDIFAIVSPKYAPADAPAVLEQIVRDLPNDARATWSYDPKSTAWELRASVWTPTPEAEQAVGEAFEGYVSFSARDNGTSRFNGGGGVSLIRCLNASTYTAEGSEVSRVHRGDVMYDIGAMLDGSLHAMNALCLAWGRNREVHVETPKGMTIEDAIPGFWRALLKDRRSELVGVLPGRSESHVQGLSAAFHGERREPRTIVRSDFAQGWTKYIQTQPTAVRREAETAIGEWLMNARPMTCDMRDE